MALVVVVDDFDIGRSFFGPSETDELPGGRALHIPLYGV
jgi:hypothetical protein